VTASGGGDRGHASLADSNNNAKDQGDEGSLDFFLKQFPEPTFSEFLQKIPHSDQRYIQAKLDFLVENINRLNRV